MNNIAKLAAASLLALSASAGAADHLYQLNGSLSDTLGGPDLVFHGGSLGLTSYTFGQNQGLTTQFSLGSVYTIDMDFSFDTHSGWQKIVDFSALAADVGMYTSGNQWNFYDVGGYTLAPADGASARLTLTRDAGNLFTMYVNGSQIGAFVDNSNKANFGANVANFFIDDIATGQREAASGSVDYIRTYDRALSGEEVGRLAPPVPEPESWAMLGAGLGLLALLRRRQRKG